MTPAKRARAPYGEPTRPIRIPLSLHAEVAALLARRLAQHAHQGDRGTEAGPTSTSSAPSCRGHASVADCPRQIDFNRATKGGIDA